MINPRRLGPCALALALAHCGGGTSPDDRDASDVAVATRDVPVAPTDAPALDAATGGDAASDGGTISPDGATPDASYTGTIPIFIAQGYVGRTTISCDDGRTWVANQSDNETIQCFSDSMSDCDHNGMRAMGLDYGDGWFVATYGWGVGNGVRRSRDGVTWEHVVSNTTFAGLNYGNSRFVVFDGTPRVSSNDGMSFVADPASIGFMGEIRGTGFADGQFVAAGAPTATQGDVMLSADGVAFHRPTHIPAQCGESVGSDAVAAARGVLLLGHDTGLVCRSTDHGATWTAVMVDGTLGSSLLDTGTEFVAWGAHSGTAGRFRSTDGMTWTFEATHTRAADGTLSGGPAVGPVARSPGGTFVTVKSGWQVWYSHQVFYRSTDGLIWDALPNTAFAPSHPIRFIRYGVAARSAACH